MSTVEAASPVEAASRTEEAIRMPPDEPAGEPPADRREPVGAPVVRGDPAVTGERAAGAAAFDPADPDSLEAAAAVVRAFATDAADRTDHLAMLRGAAACAALVGGTGSYAAAAERAGGPAGVPFVRTWARVHDLPIAIRRHVARGDVAPAAAVHVARVSGRARFLLAWAVVDEALDVRRVARLASAIEDGRSPEAAFDELGVRAGRIRLALPAATYRELHRRASLEGVEPDAVVEAALRRWFESE